MSDSGILSLNMKQDESFLELLKINFTLQKGMSSWVTITTDDLKVITRDWCPMAAFTMLHGGEHLKSI